MTDKQLIAKLQTLKQIKPRENWVVFAKHEILTNGSQVITKKKHIVEFFGSLFPTTLQTRMAYSFATLILIFAGMLGFAQYTLPGDMLFSVKKITEQSTASLSGASMVKNNIDNLKKRSQDLAVVIKNGKQSNIPSAVQEVKDAAKTLTDEIASDPTIAREVALEVKNSGTLLDITSDGSSDLKEASDNLYKTIDSQMIGDLQKSLLTEDQLKALDEIEELYRQAKYSEALEKILLINN